MALALPTLPLHTPRKEHALADRLRAAVKGDVRFDALHRTLYATDASIYEIVPLGVVMPRDIDDVVATVRACAASGASIVARGAGTGLSGGAVGPGVQLDFTRYMNRIGSVDASTRTVDVEPGVVLDELNAHLATQGLRFAPDVATSSRATIGGMIANNSCGAGSVIYGRTVDQVVELTVVLGSGEVVTFRRAASSQYRDREGAGTASCIERELGRIRDENYSEIAARFPKVMRSNGGYGLDRLGPPGTPTEAVKVLCGSEGTLGAIVSAKLSLVPIVPHRALLVLHFHCLVEALRITPAALRHGPSAVELIDALIIRAALSNPLLCRRSDFLHGEPEAVIVVELQDNDASVLAGRLEALARNAEVLCASYAAEKVCEPDRQAAVWKIRTSGLGLLMSRPGEAQPYAFVEDTAVDPARLADYIARFQDILRGEGVAAGYYAHASVGCIHIKPVLNLRRADEVEKMRRIAEAVGDLVLEFSGAISGEHGDGIVRSGWLEKMYGAQIVSAFWQVKELFDPGGIMNPHKIVDPWPMTDHLRYGPTFEAKSPKTILDFSAYGGMAGLASMCTGVGQCRQKLVGTMCPSFVATGDELHTTRARANALRVALSNRGLLDGLDDPHLEEVMDLCISCKACKTECPTGVDMARLKAEYRSRRNLVEGVGRRARLIADTPELLARAARWPRLFNLITQSRAGRAFMERRYGLDRRVSPPRLAPQTFRVWFRRHVRASQNKPAAPRGEVIYFVDTWTNYATPQVGVAAVALLEAAGYDVTCPPTVCCGRPAISQGLLTEARHQAIINLEHLARAAEKGISIVGTEPSCVSALWDEYPQLVRSPIARQVASRTHLLETFLRSRLEEDPGALAFKKPAKTLLYHAHCHQKALIGSGDAVSLLKLAYGDAASEINSGCCGMAGAFGHEVEHYEVAQAMGEERLFPAIRADQEADIAVSGFSCRHQVEHHTGRHARHAIECVAAALATRCGSVHP